ncbi:MAG TPA: hypothetical protein VK171_00230 [Fimbriimonas sp.]|nr:hypothetical protein [Fimbriimonas sp.]
MVQTTPDQPLVSNYPRGGFVSHPQNYEQSVFRQSLNAIGKRPFLFAAFGVISILIGAGWTSFVPVVVRLVSSPLSQLGYLVTSLLAFAIGRLIQYHAANEITKQDREPNLRLTTVLRRPEAWGATFVLALMTMGVSLGSAFGASTLAGFLNLQPYNLPTLLFLISTPIGVLITFRFIFAPFIAANTNAGVIGSFRESVVLTQGIGLKAAGWTLLLFLSGSVANWLPRFNLPVFSYLGYLVPLLLYVALGVWYTRRARHWRPDGV